MRYEEASVIGDYLTLISFDVCVNLGAGEVRQHALKKPWLDQFIYHPLKTRGIDIIHVDFAKYDEIDLVLDLTNTSSQYALKSISGRKCFLLCNVIEHIPEHLRKQTIGNLLEAMEPEDHLVVSVPKHYPYHADPIDSLYRPSARDLSAMLPINISLMKEVAAGNFYREIKTMPLGKRIRKLAKPLWPFQSLDKYRGNLSRLRFLFRDYVITIVAGTKR